MESTISAPQYAKLESSDGMSILKRYCSLYQEWKEILVKNLSKDWADGVVKSPLEDMSLLASYLVVQNYPPASTGGETSEILSVSYIEPNA